MGIVGMVMGSISDRDYMDEGYHFLKEMGVTVEYTIVSAHRTPQRLSTYAQSAASRGISVIIAGAGGAAHLPGMLAAETILPVIGVPIRSKNSIDGWDSLLSIVQMPKGVPVATVAINGSLNAAILATQLLAISNPSLQKKLMDYKMRLANSVMQSIDDSGLSDPLKGHL